MSKYPATVDQTDTDAQAVLSAGAILQQFRFFHLAVRLRFQDCLVDHRDIPLRQIGSRPRQLACGKHPTFSFLRSRPWRAQPVAMVASRRSWWQSRVITIEHILHSERIEDAAVQEIEHRHPATSL